MKYISGEQFKHAVYGAFKKLEQMKEEVNTLNVFPVPDGDTGTNMTLTMKSAVAQIEASNSTALETVSKALGNGSLMGARGNSGVILSQLCRGLAGVLKGRETIDIRMTAEMLVAAKDKAYKAVMKPTEGTILTVAREMAEFAEANADRYDRIDIFLSDILAQGNAALAKTPQLLPILKEAGVVDAGGQGLVYLLAGFIETLTGASADELLSREAVATEDENGAAAESRLAYAMSFAVEHEMIKPSKLRKTVAPLGENFDCVDRDGFWQVALETDQPWAVLQSLEPYGQFFRVRIDNTHDTTPGAAAAALQERPEPEAKKPMRKYGFVAVSLGEGFDRLFRDLMVDEIVSGGQTMNPSTADLFNAVSRVDAETVFILPNNKNIIMAAEQVDELSEKRVIVIPTRSIPQGFTALFNYDESLDPEENKASMTESLADIITGQVTYAIRDTEINGLQINTNDYIGLIDGQIVMKAETPEALVKALLESYVSDETSLVTIYAGADADSAKFEALKADMEETFDEIDIDCTDGGQPTYTYVFSIE